MAADPAADAADYRTRYKPGPPRKRTDESRRARDRAYSRAYGAEHPGRKRVRSPESRQRVNERMRTYLPAWRRRTGRCVSPNLVRVRWARVPGEAVFHLVPTLGGLSRRPPTPTHPICAPHLRLTKLVCPFRNRTPIVKCRDCVAARPAWEKLVAAPSSDYQSTPSPNDTAMHPRSAASPSRSAIDAHPRLRDALRFVSFSLDGLSPPGPGA